MVIWLKGTKIEMPDSIWGAVILLVIFIGLLALFIYWDMEVKEENTKIADEIENSNEVEYYVLEEDYVVSFCSFATGSDMEFIIQKGAKLKRLNDRCLLYMNDVPDEISVKYTAEGKRDELERVVLEGVSPL